MQQRDVPDTGINSIVFQMDPCCRGALKSSIRSSKSNAFLMGGQNLLSVRPNVSAPRIYVVDDEPTIAATLVAILNMHHYSAVAFTNPAVALASALLDTPDLVISDVEMPGMSGVDLAGLIKAVCPQCKVFLITGYGEYLHTMYDTRCLAESVCILHKPVHPTNLLRVIKERL